MDNPYNPRKVDIYLAKPMDYEKVSEYMLTLQVQNTPGLVAEAQLKIKVTVRNKAFLVITVDLPNFE